MPAKYYPFEGTQITVTELRVRVPAYSDRTLRAALLDGCKTVQEVIAFAARKDMQLESISRASGRRGAKAYSESLKKTRHFL